MYSLTNSLVYIVPFLISAANFISVRIIRELSKFERHTSIATETKWSSLSIASISFLNLGVMILLVNMTVDIDLPLPIFKGRYKKFTVEWYRLVGSAICFQITLLIASVNVTNMMFWLIALTKRCCDRGCTTNAKKTKKFTQEDYEEVNMGPPIMMNYKYSNMLVVSLLVMTYSAGMPVLYLVAALYYFVTYWVDKTLIFYHNRKPVFFDEKLPQEMIKWFKLAVPLHLVIGAVMLSNSNILPVKENSKSSIAETYSVGSINSKPIGAFIGLILAVIIIYVIWRFVYYYMKKLVRCLCRSCKDKDDLSLVDLVVGDNEIRDNDIYQILPTFVLEDKKKDAEAQKNAVETKLGEPNLNFRQELSDY